MSNSQHFTVARRNRRSAAAKSERSRLRPNEPFTWTSGIKSPIYCDNRLTMSYPAIRELIAEGFAADDPHAVIRTPK